MEEFLEKNSETIFNRKNRIQSYTLERIGSRDEMQDATCSIPSIPGLEDFSFYGVFDGHLSDVVSKYLAKEMLNSILMADQPLFDDLKSKTLTLNQNEIAIERLKSAMRKGFLDIDKKMLDLPEMRTLKQKLVKNEFKDLVKFESGSTAVVCLITPKHIFIANCGDSRAVLTSSNKVFLATEDHKPNNPKEKARVEKAGGKVVIYPKTKNYYIQSPNHQIKLMTSRALGDYSFKQNKHIGQCDQLVSPEPDIYVKERSERNDYLILASDGIWDHISNESIKSIINEMGSPMFSLYYVSQRIDWMSALKVY